MQYLKLITSMSLYKQLNVAVDSDLFKDFQNLVFLCVSQNSTYVVMLKVKYDNVTAVDITVIPEVS